jgi:hypothetical protein
MRYLDYPAGPGPIATIPPGQSVEVPLTLSLSPEVLSLQEDLPVQVEYTVRATAGSGSKAVESTLTGTTTTTIHRNSALTWDDTSKFAAFITPNDGVISSFALKAGSRGGLDTGWQLPGRFRRASAVLNALGSLGMTYTEDPSSPISKVLGKPEFVDTVRFPRVTIRLHTGDCDDTTALLASCLEADGIPTAILTTPDHIFLAFDSGVPEQQGWMYTSEKTEIIRYQGTLWVPLESTVMSDGFARAWIDGSKLVREYRGTADFKFLATAKAQEVYPSIPLPPSDTPVLLPTGDQMSELQERTGREIEEQLYSRLGQVLQHDIPASGPGAAAVFNKIGIVDARFAHLQDASSAFQKAVRADPTFFAAYINLGQVSVLAGDLRAAESAAVQADRMRPGASEVSLLQAQISFARGKASDAKELLSRASRTSNGELAAALRSDSAGTGVPSRGTEATGSRPGIVWFTTP